MIRDAVVDDIPAITALYGHEVLTGTATFEETPPSEAEMAARLEAVLARGLPWVVAEMDGVFAGYAYLSPFRNRNAYRYTVENSVYVAGGLQGRGVGRALLSAVIERARELGLRHVMGVISDSATSAASIGLHERLGFERAGTWRHAGWKFDRWIDVHVMQLDLDPTAAAPSAPGVDLA
ncbi:N-acetyltransferase family protein [Brevundimonas staleyi]|uniref:N-acetyltransferase family protein n=1 Tax=Brevundimonas staleyi TaxID=74326 RepID=A0ABW0FPA6_9CAUL